MIVKRIRGDYYMEFKQDQKCGLVKSVKDIKLSNEHEIAHSLNIFISSLDLRVQDSQQRSWVECIKYLKETFKDTFLFDSAHMLFEYCIPLSNFRRPDIVMLLEDKVIVLEFKRKSLSLDIDKSQLRGYLNELRNYHENTHLQGLEVIGALVVTEADDHIYHEAGIDIVEGRCLYNYLKNVCSDKCNPMRDDNVAAWLNSDYKPLLSIIDATTSMFLNGEIPQIRNIDEGAIRDTQDFILNSISQNTNKKRIFFLTGVPGAGKTLVLLNALYKLNNLNSSINFSALYTSGNGPLISTLSYILSKNKKILDGESFIKDIKNIKSSLYDKYNNKAKNNAKVYKTILFDEAQRSWDLEHMQKYNYKSSEPEVLLRLQNKAYEDFGATNLVCSYGEGQSIYIGEESGFNTWAEQLNKEEYKDWEVYIPKEFAEHFKDRDNTFISNELFIDTTIRGNFIDIDPFIKAVLDVDTQKAKEELQIIVSKGFDIKISRDITKIKSHLEEYTKESGDKFYGLVTSSNSSTFTLKNTIPNFKKVLDQRDNSRIGKWYIDDCSKLDEAAAEFGCQGLELNIPVVAFGRDYIIQENKWTVSPKVLEKAKENNNSNYKKINNYKDKDEIFKNIYRVLLSRGRYGTYLYLPDRCSDLNETYEFFKNIGVKEI